MIDIEILTAILEEMGYFDDSDGGEEEKKEEHAMENPTSKPEQKEHAEDDEQT